MIVVMQAVVMVLVAGLGLAVAVTKDPLRQLMPFSLFGGGWPSCSWCSRLPTWPCQGSWSVPSRSRP